MSDTPTRNTCYILQSSDSTYTYNGYTNRPDTRIRQHNREIVGGARATGKHGPWSYLVRVSSADPEFDHRRALSLEWHIRYPTGRRPRPARFNSPQGRIEGLLLALNHPKFEDLAFLVEVHADYLDHAVATLAGAPNVIAVDCLRASSTGPKYSA